MHTLVLLLLVGVAAAGLAPLYEVEENVKGHYLIKFKDEVDSDMTAEGIQRHVQQQRLGEAIIYHRYYNVLKGVAAKLSEEVLQYVRTLDEVEYVSEDGMAHAADIPWGLDRIGERRLPLDGRFKPDPVYCEGQGVEIWVLDTGIRPTHCDFGGRASVAFDAYGGNGKDCNGHGTHCAGIAAGSCYGVAKKATIKSVKVLGSTRCGSTGPYSKIVKGFEYVIANARPPAVVSMSISGGKNRFYETAVKKVVSAGITVVVAAGNQNNDACTKSPAWLREVITVGATDGCDKRSYFSNFGRCVDIFAPGSSIPSADWTSDTATTKKSGTSMACPHISGIAALYLGQNRNLSPARIKSKLRRSATRSVLSDIGRGSPNLLAYIDP